MFLHLSVILFTGDGVCDKGGVWQGGVTRAGGVYIPNYSQQASDMHPTGMLPSLEIVLIGLLWVKSKF